MRRRVGPRKSLARPVPNLLRPSGLAAATDPIVGVGLRRFASDRFDGCDFRRDQHGSFEFRRQSTSRHFGQVGLRGREIALAVGEHPQRPQRHGRTRHRHARCRCRIFLGTRHGPSDAALLQRMTAWPRCCLEIGDRCSRRLAGCTRSARPADPTSCAEFKLGCSFAEQIDEPLPECFRKPRCSTWLFKMALSRAASCFGSSARTMMGTPAAKSASRSQTICRAASNCLRRSSILAASVGRCWVHARFEVLASLALPRSILRCPRAFPTPGLTGADDFRIGSWRNSRTDS